MQKFYARRRMILASGDSMSFRLVQRRLICKLLNPRGFIITRGFYLHIGVKGAAVETQDSLWALMGKLAFPNDENNKDFKPQDAGYAEERIAVLLLF